MAAKNKTNEIHITRIYDAPVKVVWEAWTDPDQVAKWWGPRGFTLTTHSKDLRTGGDWRYTMHGPDGTDYENHTKYLEVETSKKLVYDHGGYKDRPPLFRVTVTFNDVKGGKTKMDMTMTLPSIEAAEETRKFIKKAGGDSTWDRLAEYLEKESSGIETFVINRAFDAPIETLFKLWTDPEHVAKWLPPTGVDMEYLKADIREGGTSIYKMGNGSITMYGRAHYLEIKSPNRLVYTQQFTDKDGNLSRHPALDVFPETMLTTIQFSAEDAGRTRVTVRWEPYGKTTKEEIEAFVAIRPSMTGGWTGSFDKLEGYIEKIT